VVRVIFSRNRQIWAGLRRNEEGTSLVNSGNNTVYSFIGWQKAKLKCIESGNPLPELTGIEVIGYRTGGGFGLSTKQNRKPSKGFRFQTAGRKVYSVAI
jgi:hypothetical protein